MTTAITKESLAARIAELESGARSLKEDYTLAAYKMLLATMAAEPVALQPELAKVIYHFRDWNEGFPVERFKADYVISWMLANYPPAQPAPVVPEEMPCGGAADDYHDGYQDGWNACRAAMKEVK